MYNYDTGTGTSTATYGGNDFRHYVFYCKRCGQDKDFCLCWFEFMESLKRVIEQKLMRDIYKSPVKNSILIKIINIIRRTPTSISGMKGLKLLKKMDKR